MTVLAIFFQSGMAFDQGARHDQFFENRLRLACPRDRHAAQKAQKACHERNNDAVIHGVPPRPVQYR